MSDLPEWVQRLSKQLSEWTCTGECRWILRSYRMNQEGPFFNANQVKVLQQKWERSSLHPRIENAVGWETEWRDVPTKESSHE